MLTPQEEVVLRRLAQEHTPMTRLPVKHTEQPIVDTDAWLRREFAKCEKLRPMDAEQDWTVINTLRSAGVLGKREKVMEFFSRTGIGRAQVLTMSKDELRKAVALADERNANEGGYRPQTFSDPQSRPAASQMRTAVIVG
jgi:hypothetical protein